MRGRGMRGPGRGGRRTMRRQHRRRRRRRMILVGGLIAIGTYKLTKKDTERVEEHTGKKAEDLTEEELEKALDDLQIEKQKVSDEEIAEAEKAGTGATDTAAAAQPDAQGGSYSKELEQLADLHEKGILTDEEFAAKKTEILGL